MDIWGTLQAAVEKYPDRVAVVDGDERFTYRQVADRAATLALLIRGRRIERGDRIAILEPNSHYFLESYYAAAAIGAILCPLNVRLSAVELAAILADCQASCLIANPAYKDRISGVIAKGHLLQTLLWTGEKLAEGLGLDEFSIEHETESQVSLFDPVCCAAEDVAHLYYTSGTTGRPKGVMLTHGNVCKHAETAIAELDLCGSDIWGHIAPMFHLADAWATFAFTLVGGRHVMCRRFQAEEVLDSIERERVTITNLIPTMLNLMNECLKARSRDLSHLRTLLSGGAPIAPELVRSVIEIFGCDYIQTYGMTETSPYLTLSILAPHLKELPEDEQLVYKAKTGRPFAAVELKVVDENGDPVAADDREVGEILVRGPTVTPGYWRRPEETGKAFCDGWLKTGDLATIDSEGYINIVDRKKDMIITGGENVYSIEVENTLYAHPAVLEAAVFGAPHPKWGEAVHAAVVLHSGRDTRPDDLIEFCKEHLASFKVPKSVFFLESLPRTGSGKITKTSLRQLCEVEN